MANALKWLDYDFLIALAYLLNLRASVSSWLIFSIQENQSHNMDSHNFKRVFNQTL